MKYKEMISKIDPEYRPSYLIGLISGYCKIKELDNRNTEEVSKIVSEIREMIRDYEILEAEKWAKK